MPGNCYYCNTENTIDRDASTRFTRCSECQRFHATEITGLRILGEVFLNAPMDMAAWLTNHKHAIKHGAFPGTDSPDCSCRVKGCGKSSAANIPYSDSLTGELTVCIRHFYVFSTVRYVFAPAVFVLLHVILFAVLLGISS